MVVGLLPAIRGGLCELARTGQESRLLEGYVRPYGRAFGEIRYFSYFDERLDTYTQDAELLKMVRLYGASSLHPWLYTLWMPIRHRRALRECAVLRVFQVTGALPAVIAKRRFGVPFVTTYGFWYTRLARSPLTRALRAAAERLGLAAADAIIVPTEELRVHVATRVGPDRVHLVPNGVDVARFRPAVHVPRGQRRIIYVGRLSGEKNLEVLVEATAKLLARFDVRLVIVGDGPLRRPLEELARRRGVAVDWRRVVPHAELPSLLAAADAFVLPSLTVGHPKVLLEAMACGVPCVASSVGGNRAIVADGDSGLLFDPRDPGALAERLERVLDDEELARRLRRRGRAEVEARYSLSELVQREIRLVRSVARAQ